MKNATALIAVCLLSFAAFAKDKTPKNYEHGTYMGLHRSDSGYWTPNARCFRYGICSGGAGLSALTWVGATVKADSGLEYDFLLYDEANGSPTWHDDPVRKLSAGESVQFRIEARHTSDLTQQQIADRDLNPHPNTSENVKTYLFLLMPNGKERRYYLGLTNPNEKLPEAAPALAGSKMAAATAAGIKSVDDITAMSRKIMEHQATTLSDNVLRQMCSMDSGDHNYYQPYCDELKKREAAKQPTTTPESH